MLRIERAFGGKRVSDRNAADTNQFLESILVEVATENYRQLIHEAVFMNRVRAKPIDYLPDPPLRSNEEVLSGLFATAISRVASRSRTEVQIGRERLEKSTSPDGAQRPGHVDHLAWYGERTYAIELKMAAMDFDSKKKTNDSQKKWESAIKQAKQAQVFLRKKQKEERLRYPNPISLALLVVVGRRDAGQSTEHDVEAYEKSFLGALSSFKPAPPYRAIYTFPEEFRRIAKKQNGLPSGKPTYMPFVAFLAKAAVNDMT